MRAIVIVAILAGCCTSRVEMTLQTCGTCLQVKSEIYGRSQALPNENLQSLRTSVARIETQDSQEGN